MSRKTKANEFGITFDLSELSLVGYMQFADFVGEGHYSSALPLITPLIDDWGSLEKGTDLKSLPFTSSMKLIKLLQARSQEVLAAQPESKIKVNLENWTMEDFETFVDASQEADHDKLFSQIEKIADLEGRKVIDLLLLEYGGLLAAVNAAVKKSFQ